MSAIQQYCHTVCSSFSKFCQSVSMVYSVNQITRFSVLWICSQSYHLWNCFQDS